MLIETVLQEPDPLAGLKRLGNEYPGTFIIIDIILFGTLAALIYFVVQRHKEEKPLDDKLHEGLPDALRGKTPQELRQIADRSEILDTIRKRFPQPAPPTIAQKVEKLQALEELKADLKAKYPNRKKDIDALIESERIKELEKQT